jgi:aminoglycoside phosphotransferase family enzyme
MSGDLLDLGRSVNAAAVAKYRAAAGKDEKRAARALIVAERRTVRAKIWRKWSALLDADALADVADADAPGDHRDQDTPPRRRR